MVPANLMISAQLSVAQIKKILAVKEKLEKLETRKDKIDSDIARAEKELAGLLRGTQGKPGSRKKAKKKARKKVRKKVKAAKKAGKTVRMKIKKKKAKKAVKKTAKKTARKVTKRKARKVVKKAGKKKVVKKTGRKTPRKAGKVRGAPKTRSKPTLEEVVAVLIKSRGKPIAFQDILGTIQKRKLFTTKSKNFANVLRRTLSTSKMVKRVGRGVYGLA